MNFPPFLQALREMRLCHPRLHLNIQEDVSSRIYERVRDQEVNIGILRIASVPDDELDMCLLAQHRLLMAIPAKHPLATKKNCTCMIFHGNGLLCPGQGMQRCPAVCWK